MQAVVFDLDRKIRMVDRPEPTASELGMLLRPSHVGICGTDLHAEALEHFRPGVVMGHEFSARVVEPRASAGRFAEGDLVVVNPNGNLCGACDECRAGRTNLCASAVFEHGIGIHDNGGMAPLVAVDERVVFEVPSEVTELQAAWVEPLATAVRAVKRSGCSQESTTVVVGAGPIGLLVAQVLRDAGVSRIGVIEPSRYRREVAMKVGADYVLAPDDVFPTAYEPVDVTFECSGSSQGFEAAAARARPGGTAVVVGLAPHPVTVEPFRLVGRELTILGSIIYRNDDFLEALLLLQEHRIDVDTLTTDVLPLARHEDAFALLRESAAAIKILLLP